ncbi:MAG TPA: CehA/McbA family metallohydrolase, partial [Chthoniobacteraceae bacterium]|nr:CehA/McbA family metallohydrolase [Chthoniobacteraceae bacterium]
MRHLVFLLGVLTVSASAAGPVEPQPFFAALRQLIEATDFLGAPFSEKEKAILEESIKKPDDPWSIERAAAILDARALFQVTINPEQRVKVSQGPAKPELDEGGWRQFLVKVFNEAGTTAPLQINSPEAGKVFGGGNERRGQTANGAPLSSRWLDLQSWNSPPMRPALSGLSVEYRIVGLYSRDAGRREARFHFDVGQGTQDLGFRSEASVLFTARPARVITLRIVDENGAPCTASLEIRDRAGHVYPSQIKRLAPDLGFHPQIYREDGEKLRLPDGAYRIVFQRGPESMTETRDVVVTAGTNELSFKVKRWIDPSKFSWWSGDHHIHAAGCAHYTSPTEGVHAPDMARHCQGEDLKIGANLTWGPCFDYQKQFFTGREDATSKPPYLLRYDIEVSGFGSHQSGHLCLLRLRDQVYPGGDSMSHWPTLGLSTLRWAQKQGAVCGPAHSGWGLGVQSEELPNYEIPPFDGIGANEYIVDVTHDVEGPDGKPVPAVDFISTVDTPPTWELNIWYHTLNAGFRTRISGETDFPCIYGERVGLGRSYVKTPAPLSYDEWCEGIAQGRCYVSDGRTHLMDFSVDGQLVGEKGSEIRLTESRTVKLSAQVAALLAEKADPAIRAQRAPANAASRKGDGRFDANYRRPYWTIERARIGESRMIPVEVIVNGRPVAKREIAADGNLGEVTFDVPIERSSWVALRVLPAAHTNPVFVLV